MSTTLREELSERISKNRDLSESSVRTYVSTLACLYKAVSGDDTEDEYVASILKDVPRVLEFIDNPINNRHTPNKRKSILSALVVLTGSKKYLKEMRKDMKAYGDEIDEQKKTETQEESWITRGTIDKIFKELERYAKLFYKNHKDVSEVNVKELKKVQNYIIVALLGGIYIEPRRAKDYVDFKIRNIDKEKDNYMQGNKFVFNSYKTAKFYGRDEIKIPTKMRYILEKWIKYNPTDYLLFNNDLNKLSNVTLNQRLNEIFGNKVGVNQLRHTFITEVNNTPQMDTLKEKKKIMKNMGSSVNMIATYDKKD